MKTKHTANDLQQRIAKLIDAGTAKSTRRAYTRDINYIHAYLKLSLNLDEHYPVTVDEILRFILDHVGDMPNDIAEALMAKGLRKNDKPLRINTLRRYLTSLSVAHQERGLVSPTYDPSIGLLLRRAANALKQRPRKKAAITRPVLMAMLATCDNSLHGVRNKALLLSGFAAGGRRRSELVSLKVEHLKRIKGGYIIKLPKSKTDQAGKGQSLPLLGTAAKALSEWLIRAGIREGHLFRGIRNNNHLNPSISGRAINDLVKHHAKLAGFNPDDFGAHSLRAGFITEAGCQGISLKDAMQLSGHHDTTVALGYYRHGQLISNPATKLVSDINDNNIKENNDGII